MLTHKGRYTARATAAALKESNNGNKYIVMRFAVTQGPLAGESAFKKFHFTDKTIERTVEDLQLCGWTGDDPAEIGLDAPISLVGCDTHEVSITTEHEEYTDKEGNPKTAVIVTWINPLDGGLKSNVEKGDALAFGASMKGRIAALKAKSAASGTAPLKPQQRASAPAQQHARPAPSAPAKTAGPGFGASDFPTDDSDIPF